MYMPGCDARRAVSATVLVQKQFFISFGTCVYVLNVIKLICYREKEWMCEDLSW